MLDRAYATASSLGQSIEKEGQESRWYLALWGGRGRIPSTWSLYRPALTITGCDGYKLASVAFMSTLYYSFLTDSYSVQRLLLKDNWTTYNHFEFFCP
jgi:hypothetical protein